MADEEGVSPEEFALHQKRLSGDYKMLAKQLWGKRILRHLYVICGQGRPSFTRGEPESTFFREGRRSIWLEVESALRWKLEQREKFLEEENE